MWQGWGRQEAKGTPYGGAVVTLLGPAGWRDAEDVSAPLVYALLLRRCRQGHCEEFCVYKGSLSTYGAVLPPGFAPHFEVGLAVVVQDQLGAAVVALNRWAGPLGTGPGGWEQGLLPLHLWPLCTGLCPSPCQSPRETP